MPAKSATAKQLSYLKALGHRTGQTFTYPKTASEASREIQRLKRARSDSAADRRREGKEVADAIHAGPDNVAARVRTDEVDGHGGRATWVQNRPQDPPTLPEPPAAQRRTVGPRRELGRYTADGRERVVWGQRVDGVVRFQPGQDVVVDPPRDVCEDGTCRRREQHGKVERADAARPKRPNGAENTAADALPPRGVTGRRVELARYRISAGERALFGQRVDGVVRVTDVPLKPGGRAYLVERGLEEEGPNANAALEALISDYVRQAGIRDDVPMAAAVV